MLRRFVGVVISLVFSLNCFSSGNLLTERYNQTYLDLSNGLPHNNVSALYTDSNGFSGLAHTVAVWCDMTAMG